MTDTLRIDHQLLEQLQQDPRYGYAIEEDKPSLFDELGGDFMRWLFRFFDNDHIFNTTTVLVCCTLVTLLLLWWLLKSRMVRIFLGRQLHAPLSLEEAEENIHAVDFEKEIALARKAGDYTRAARLLYLYTLKRLSDARFIDWQPQKTPSQYTRELHTDDAGDSGRLAAGAFLELTNHFLRIRYGGFEADEPLFKRMSSLADETLSAIDTGKGGEP